MNKQSDTRLRHQYISLQEAASAAPVWAQLMQRLDLSHQCAQAVSAHIPPAMRAHIQFGVVTQGQWTVFVANNAAAAKLRQMVPVWLQALQQQQLPVQQIRLQIQVQAVSTGVGGFSQVKENNM